MHICYNFFSLLSKSKIYLLSIFLSLSTFSFSQTKETNKVYIDSMMQIINHTKGQEKLEALNSLAWGMCAYADGIEYVEWLRKEAIKQSNNTMVGNSYYYQAKYYFNVKQIPDSCIFYLDRADAVGFDHIGKAPLRLRVVNYINAQRYTTTFYYLKGLLEEQKTKKDPQKEAIIYSCLGQLYYVQRHFAEAEKAYNTSLEIWNTTSSDKVELESKLESYITLLSIYRFQKKYDLALSLEKIIFDIFNQLEKDTKVPMEDFDRYKSGVFALIGEVYIDMYDFSNARKYLNNANIYFEKNNQAIEVPYSSIEANFYYNKGEYSQALKYLDKVLQYAPSRGMLFYKDNLRSKSNILQKLNRDEEALILLQKSNAIEDSLNIQNLSAQLLELETIYEVDKIKTDIKIKNVQLERNKVIITASIIFSLLLLFITIFTIRNKRDREKKNKKIYEQYQLMKSYLDQIRKQRDELKLAREDQEEETINWAERANNYLLETEAFKKEDLSRDDLALALGTNRQYLIDAIKNETGKTFKDYINSIRIEYAYEILITDWDANIESIYIASGFTTRSTFNRLFKEYYGMNPIEMREAAKQKEEVIVENDEKID